MKKSNGYPYWLRFFLCVCLAAATLPGSGQAVLRDPVDSTSNGRKPLMEVLIELNHARGVYFLFSQQQIGKMLVNPPVLSSNAGVEKLLTQVLRNTGLIYKKVDERTFVILNRKKDTTATAPGAAVQGSAYPDDEPADAPPRESAPNTISGKIIDIEGKVLTGVTVSVKNTHRGTSTDLDGEFSIRADNDDMLLLSCVGYVNKEIPAGLAARGSIVLNPSDQPLMEVLVTALGIGKPEKTLGYSASELDGG